PELRRVLRQRDRVQVHHAVDGVVGLLQCHPLPHGTEVVAQVEGVGGRLDAGEHAWRGHGRSLVAAVPYPVGHAAAPAAGPAPRSRPPAPGQDRLPRALPTPLPAASPSPSTGTMSGTASLIVLASASVAASCEARSAAIPAW